MLENDHRLWFNYFHPSGTNKQPLNNGKTIELFISFFPTPIKHFYIDFHIDFVSSNKRIL